MLLRSPSFVYSCLNDTCPQDFESSPGPNELTQFHVVEQKNAKGEKRVHESILADRRWPALRRLFAETCPANASISDTDMLGFESWDPLGLKAQCWNEVMWARSAAGLDEAFFKVRTERKKLRAANPWGTEAPVPAI